MRLIDADALKETIGECPENWTDSPVEVAEFNIWHRVMDDIDSAPTIGGWISVNDRLPMDGQDILACLHNYGDLRIAPCNYDSGIWYDCLMNCEAVVTDITHWMPVPKPPKEENENASD